MKRNLFKIFSVVLAAAIIVCSAPLSGIVGLKSSFAPKASAATGTSVIKSYAELAAEYDNFIYLASEVYEVETADGTLNTVVTSRELTDYYVDAGQLLEERFFVKGDFYFGNFWYIKAYDNAFFDVTQVTTQAPGTNGYSIGYTGPVNAEHPVVIKNDLTSLVTSAKCATENWMKNRSGYTADELAVIDYVQAVVSYSGDKADTAYVFDRDDWIFSWNYKVKDGLADGTTGYSKTLPGFWNCDDATSDAKVSTWVQRKGSFCIKERPATATEADDNYVYVNDTKTSFVNYDIIGAFLFDGLEHNFTIGVNPNAGGGGATDSVEGVSKVKSYAELAAEYDNFIYLASEVYEVETADGTLNTAVTDRTLTDYYVDAGQLLEERFYIKGDFYFGNFQYIKAYDNAFFDVAQVTTQTPGSNGYSIGYTGPVNAEHPVVIKNDLESLVTSAKCATENWMIHRSGYTADELAVIDYVQAVVSYSGNKADTAYVFDDDMWIFSWTYKVKDGLANGTTGYTKTLPGFWNCDDATSERNTMWIQRKGTIGIKVRPADASEADDNNVFVIDTKTSFVNYDFIEAFLFDDLEHHFVIGSLTRSVKFLDNDGTEISSSVYKHGSVISVPAEVDGQIGWADTSTGLIVDLTEYKLTQNIVFKRVLETDEFDIVLNVNGGTADADALPDNAFVNGDGNIVVRARFSEEVDLSEIPLPVMEGYTGVWDTESIIIDNIKGKSAGVIWKANTYTATFYAKKGDAEPVAVVDVIYKNIVRQTLDPPEGYKFAGWMDAETDEVVSTSVILRYSFASDKSFYAVWVEYDSAVTFMIRDYDNGSGWIPAAVKYGDSGKTLTPNDISTVLEEIKTDFEVSFLSTPIRPVYSDSSFETFVDTSSGLVFDGYQELYVATTISFDVLWQMPVSVNSGGTTDYITASASYVTSVSGTENVYGVIASSGLTVPVGYTVSGWFNEATGEILECDENGNVLLTKNAGSDLVLTALLEPTKHYIYWDAISSTECVEYRYGDTIVLPDPPEREGFTFVGWSPEVPETITYDLYFTAIYELSSGSCGENASFVFDSTTGKIIISGEGEITNAPWSSDDASFLVCEAEIAEGITSICDSAFYGCGNLYSVRLPKSLVYVGESAFENCDALTEVDYLGNLKKWNSVYIGEGNECLTSANINITYTDEDRFTYTIENGEATVTGYDMNLITDGVIVIPSTLEGCPVTAIGEKAFFGHYEIVSVTILQGVKRIGASAFSQCTSLGTVNIAEGVETIDKSAFYGCTELKDILVPEGVVSIGVSSFANCTALSDVTLPSTLTSIGSNAFNGSTNLKSIHVSENNAIYSSDANGVLYNKDKTELKMYPIGKSTSTFRIPEGVTTIAASAFKGNKNINYVVVPEGVVTVGTTAFAACTALSTIEIPLSLTTVSNGAFSGCTALMDVYYGGTLTQWQRIYFGTSNDPIIAANLHYQTDPEKALQYEIIDDCAVVVGYNSYEFQNEILRIPETLGGYPVTEIGENAFVSLPMIETITIADSVKIIGDGAFDNCDRITEFTFGSGIESIGNRAFYDCDGIRQLSVPDSVKSIGESAFEHCTALFDIDFGNGVESIGSNAFNTCTQLSRITIPDSVTFIGQDAFYDCDSVATFTFGNGIETIGGTYGLSSCNSLRNLIIPDGVKAIGESAFYYCYNIASVTIGNGVESIGEYAFYYCRKLQTINLPESLERIGEEAFESCDSLSTVTIPDGVKTIGKQAFAYCYNLSVVNVGSGVTSIGSYAFGGNGRLTAVYVSEDNQYYADVDGVLYNKNVTELILYPQGKTETVFLIPDTVEKIRYNSLRSDYLADIYLGVSVKDVSDITTNCYVTNLANIFVPEENPYFADVDGVLFSKDMTKLVKYPRAKAATEYTVPDGVLTVEGYAFDRCNNLVTVTIPDCITSLGKYSFYCCSALNTVIIGNGVEKLGEYTFYQCHNLDNVVIGIGVKEIDSNACYYCNNFSGFTVSEENECFSTVDGVLFNKDKTVLISYPRSKTETEYTIPDGVVAVADRAFYDCDNIREIEMPDSLVTIGEYAFYSCGYITEVVISDSVTSIGDYAFYDCYDLVSVTIGDGVESFGQDVFSYCYDLETITLGSGVREFNGNVLGYVSNLKNIFVSQDNPCLSDEDGILFTKDKTELLIYPVGRGDTEYVVPDGVRIIGDSAFEDNRKLTNVVLPDGLVSIGNDAFDGCDGLTNIDFPDSITSIGNQAFFDCDNLTDLVLPDSLVFMGRQAFSYCPNVKNVTIGSKMKDFSPSSFKYGCYVENIIISEENPYLSSVDGIIFSKDITKLIFCPPKKSLEEYTVPDGVQIIGNNAFEDSSLKKIYLPDSLRQIQSEAFFACENLDELIISDGVTYIGDYAFTGADIKTLVIPDSVRYLGNGFAYGCYSLESIYIGSGVEQIFAEFTEVSEPWIFAYCKSLKEINVSEDNLIYSSENGVLFNKDKTELIRYPEGKTETSYVVPANVKTIGFGAFYSCENLAEITLPQGLVSIEAAAFIECENLDVTEIPDSLEIIGISAFSETKSENNPANYNSNGDFVIDGCLIEINSSSDIYVVGGDIRVVAEGAMMNSNVNKIIVDAANTSCEVVDGVLFTLNGKVLSRYPYGKTDESYTVPDGVERIAGYAFVGNDHLKNVAFSDSVESVGFYSFFECDLENIDLNDGLKEIEDGAFGMCTNLSSVEIPDSVEKFGGAAFCGSGITEAIIGDGVKSIGAGAFLVCNNLNYVYIPNSVSRIGEYAFVMCDNLETVYYDGSKEEWNKIFIDGENEPLLNADIIFDLVTVTWNVDGEETVVEYQKGDKIVLPETPVKVGYDFAGWTPEVPEIMPGKSLEFSATWELRSHNVTWICDETEITVTHKYGEEITIPDPPEKEGHTFAGWSPEIPETMPDSELEFTAQWTVNSYNVTWISDGTETLEQFDYGSAILPPVPEKEGHSFVGWTPEIPEIMPAEDLVFTAVFEVNTYKVDWYIDGLSMHETYQYGDTIVKPKAFNKKGYTFAGWTPEIPETMPAYDIEFNATWTANFYEAVFSANGGLFPDGDSIKKFSTEYITQITLPPTPVREGYEFVGWAFNGKNIGTNVGIMDSIEGKEFEAIWMSNETTKYRIETYTMNTVGEYERTAITLNGNLYDAIALSPEAEEGFVLNEEKSVLSGTLTANNTLVLKVYYDRCQYKFKVFASGTETITLYYYGAMIAEPAVPEKEGYVFDGWSSEIPATMPAENVSVSAKFRKAQNVDRTPSIVIVTPEDHTLNYGESITLQVRATYLPAGSSIKWSVEGDGVSIKPSTNGRNCKVTSTSNGNVVVKAYVVDSRGNSIAGSDGKPLADIEYIYSKVTFWQIVISYIRQIFGITNNIIF